MPLAVLKHPIHVSKHILSLTLAMLMAALVLTSALLLCAPAPVLAQDPNVGHIVQELERLNDEIWMQESTIKNNRYTLKAISSFSAMARGWFTRADNLKQQMRQAQVDGDQFMYQSLKGQLDSLQELDGQVIEVWDGTSVDSLSGLRAKFSETAQDLAPLVRQNDQAQAELDRLIPQRDQYQAQYEEYKHDTSYRLKSLEWEYQGLKEDYDYLSEMSGDPDVWLLSTPNSIFVSKPMFANKYLLIEIITQKVMQECIESGQPFNSNDLAQRIKNAQAASNASKNEINQRLADISKRLQEIEIEVATIKSGGDLAGCWMLNLGNKQAFFQVQERNPGTYEGYIASDTLKNYDQGDLAFRVSPVQGKPGIYKGTEYGYDGQGNFREYPLTIRLYQDSMAYSSDENVSMTRCQ